MIITGSQIRAARGLLGWSQDDLVTKTEVNRKTVRQIEQETVQPQEKTLTRIFSVFDKHGVEFLEDEGVKLRRQHARIYAGKVGFRQFLDHVYETVKDGGHIRQFNFSDMRYMPYGEGFVFEHLERMANIQGLEAKALQLAGEFKIPSPYGDYRTLDGTFKEMAPWYLYGDFLALSLNESGNKREFVTIESKLLADRYLKEFDIFWNFSSPKKKNAK